MKDVGSWSGRLLASLLAAASPFDARSATAGDAWRAVEGVWRITDGDPRCPEPGTLWVYAFSDAGTRLLLWTGNGSGVRPPIVLPERLGARPRLQGRPPFYDTRILSADGATLRNRHETLRADGDRLLIDAGGVRCSAVRER